MKTLQMEPRTYLLHRPLHSRRCDHHSLFSPWASWQPHLPPCTPCLIMWRWYILPATTKLSFMRYGFPFAVDNSHWSCWGTLFQTEDTLQSSHLFWATEPIQSFSVPWLLYLRRNVKRNGIIFQLWASKVSSKWTSLRKNLNIFKWPVELYQQNCNFHPCSEIFWWISLQSDQIQCLLHNITFIETENILNFSNISHQTVALR